jgi:hypothetical protein
VNRGIIIVIIIIIIIVNGLLRLLVPVVPGALEPFEGSVAVTKCDIGALLRSTADIRPTAPATTLCRPLRTTQKSPLTRQHWTKVAVIFFFFSSLWFVGYGVVACGDNESDADDADRSRF